MREKITVILLVTIALISFSGIAFAVNFNSRSDNINNIYFPLKVGTWEISLGSGNWIGKFVYINAVGTDVVSGIKIGTQTFNNVKCLKCNYLSTVNNDILTFWIAQDTQGNVWFLKVYSHNSEATFMLGQDFKSMLMPAIPHVGDDVSLTVPETENDYCQCVEVNISLITNFGSYDSCIKANCFHESGDTEVDYYCPNVGIVRSSTVQSPDDVVDLKDYGIATITKGVVIPLGD